MKDAFQPSGVTKRLGSAEAEVRHSIPLNWLADFLLWACGDNLAITTLLQGEDFGFKSQRVHQIISKLCRNVIA